MKLPTAIIMRNSFMDNIIIKSNSVPISKYTSLFVYELVIYETICSPFSRLSTTRDGVIIKNKTNISRIIKNNCEFKSEVQL